MLKYLESLEKQRSNLTYSTKLLDQNIKYMTRRNSIPIAEKFEQTKKQRELNLKQLKILAESILNAQGAVMRLKKEIEGFELELEAEKNIPKNKVLEFRRKQ